MEFTVWRNILPFFRLPQIKLPLGHGEEALRLRIVKLLRIAPEELEGYTIEKKSFDARDRNDIRVVYAVTAKLRNEPVAEMGESDARMTRTLRCRIRAR